ncbi:MAG: dihydrofolate synthase / folylpolyglutamate synthase [Alphaproteobacteria bacterium]|nr:MAG: dihydrofolate synthase / folylpolyglutamate synthase [Caulobacteraceae bacterium]TPW04605.1 MAG: dihydrofolate synthase / folylpolyglutamate synthase [Alphaproteobacteria bacterium]
MIISGRDPVSLRLAEIGQEFGHGMALKLDRIEAALEALGRPQDRLPPVLHVAGTNGKGSTCAFLRAMTEAAGMRAHVFTSPHLIVPNERVRLAGTLASDEVFITAIDRVAALGMTLPYFEVLTAAALLMFSESPADVLILEVGLGGRFDATNVIANPAATVIAPIALDHTAILGDTLTLIAGEKAGILKRGAPAVVARQPEEATAVIEARAADVGAPLFRCGVDWDAWRANGRLAVQTQDRFLDLPAPNLAGAHQFDNAALAAATLLAWDGARFDDDALTRGVTTADWPGRMQRLTQGPLADIAHARGAELWLDGGHNPHGALALAATLRDLHARAPRPLVLITGMLTTKDVDGFLAPLAPLTQTLIAVPVTSSAASYEAEPLAAIAARNGIASSTAASLVDAMKNAAALQGEPPRIVICGSLYLAGDALALSGGVA